MKRILMLVLLVSFSVIANERILIARTNEISSDNDYRPHIHTPAEYATISNQLDYYKKLGYSHIFYSMMTVGNNGYNFIKSGTSCSWQYAAPYDNNDIHSSLVLMKDTVEANGMELIPVLRNPLGHSKYQIIMHPQLSAIPIYENLRIVKMDSQDRNNENFYMSIANVGEDSLFAYVVHKRNTSMAAPSWLSSSSSEFIKIKISYKDLIINRWISGTTKHIANFDLYRTKDPIGKNSFFEFFSNIEPGSGVTSDFMYSVLISKSNFDPINDMSSGVVGPTELLITNFTSSDITLDDFDNLSLNPFNNTGLYTYEFNFREGYDFRGLVSHQSYMRYKLNDGYAKYEYQNELPQNCLPYYDETVTGGIEEEVATSRNTLFREDLKLLKAGYNYPIQKGTLLNTTTLSGITKGDNWPKMICLGYDELGKGGIKLIFDDAGGKTAAEKVAEDIAFRISEIDNAFPKSNGTIKILLYGDSFVPNDNGEIYGLANRSSGDDVLEILGAMNDNSGNNLKSRIIILPWRYDNMDHPEEYGPAGKEGPHQIPFYFGQTHEINGIDYTYPIPENVKFDKWEQIKYLNEKGFDFIPLAGEENCSAEEQGPCTFEWVRAGETFSNHCVGYGHFQWHNWNEQKHIGDDTHSDKGMVGEQAALLPFLLNYPELVKRYHTDPKLKYHNNYVSGINWSDNINASGYSDVRTTSQSRIDMDWREGTHYKPGLAFAKIENSNFFTPEEPSAGDYGRWSPDLTFFEINGTAGSFWDTNENTLYSFLTIDKNFEFNTKVEELTGHLKAGILLKESTSNGSKLIYLHYNDNSSLVNGKPIGKNITVHVRTVDNGPIYQLEKFIDEVDISINAAYLKVRRVGKNVQLLASKDGKSYTLLANVPFKEGKIFAGLSAGAGSSTAPTKFTNIEIKDYGDITPAINLLLD